MGVLKVGGEVLVAVAALVLLTEEVEVVAAVVAELVGVAGVEALAVAHHVGHHVGVLLQDGGVADLGM